MNIDRRNVVLTGFMGTGKSTIGRLVAARLGYAWVDTDEVIAHRHGPIAEIFAGDGEQAFRSLERDLAIELGSRQGLVISTGGRLMLDPVAAAALDGGRVFCLTASPRAILDRIGAEGVAARPLLAGDEPERVIAELLAERATGYARFPQVPTDGKTATQVADDVIALLDASEPSTGAR